MFEILKDLYYKGEEKWYAFWDKINEHLPVYSIIDKIDAIVPSFALFLILIIFLILFGAFILFAQNNNSYFAEITFYEPNGRTKILESMITIQILQAGNVTSESNYYTNTDGVILLEELKYGQEIRVIVDLTKGTYDGLFLIDEIENKEKIVLKEKIDLSPIKRTITLKDYSGITITQPIELDFWCENKAVQPTPTKGVTQNGIIQITEPYDCTKLYASPNSKDFTKKSYLINSTSYDMTLEKYEPPKTELKVKVRDTKGSPISEVNFTINANGTELYTQNTLSASEATLNVVPGNYTIAVTDPTNKYATKVTQNITVETKKEITIEVTKEIRARINVKTIDVSTKNIITESIVSLKNKKGALLSEQKTENNGTTIFPITDVDDYTISAKKLGDLNGGYYAKTITLTQVTSDINVILELERITISNAGKTKVRVIDQDGEAVSNAKIMLKYKDDDSIVELNQANNWAMSDFNGYATFLAGKVEGIVYAYAMKYPFSGSSETKTIIVDKENEFTINMDVGEATIKLNLFDEAGQKIEGTTRILLTSDNKDLSGLMLVEEGIVQRKIKAGQQVYLAIQSEGYENYLTEPRMLFPNKTYTFNVTMKKQITKPQIFLENLYNENDAITRTLQVGKKYYAKIVLESDEKYDDVIVHFRVGKEKLLENDYLEIDKVEGANVAREERGTSYDPERGYSYDSQNITDGYSKWINIEFDNFEKGTRVIKVWFNVKRNTPANKELQLFYKAKFDNTKDPPTTNTANELYDSTKSSNIYYVGEEATCEESFCTTNESLYWNKDDLYVNAPYQIKQAKQYTYKYQLVNNSDTDYGTNVKNMYLNLELLNDDKTPIKIIEYKIKDNAQEKGGNGFTKISNLEVKSFNKNTAIDFSFVLEGNEVGASAIKLELKSDGEVIYTKESTFNVPEEKQMQIRVNPTFVPSLANTPIIVEVYDEKGEPINKAIVRTYAKEPGFDQYLVDSSETTRVGKTQVNSGAHFPKTKVIIEITKEGFARTILSTTVTEDIVAFNPNQAAITLNTISKREDKREITIGNQTTHKIRIVSIKYDTKFEGIINEESMRSHSEQLIGQIIPAEETIDLELIKVRLVNSITQNNFIEPITIEGDVIVTFEIIETRTMYDKVLPLTINVSSEANTDSSCLYITNANQTKTTQLGQVRFDFEVQNGCQADGKDVDLDAIHATFAGELKGKAEISITSPISGNSGRSALDGAKRKVYDKIKGGEKLVGSVIYTPSTEAVGSKETLNIVLEGKFQGRNIKTNPASLNFSVNVLNLKECMSISSDAAPVAFDGKTNITVDASGCLGQTIDIALCKDDAGCSGGAEGKITLTKRTLTLKGNSETIEAYSPSLPGTYGVSVHARIKGKSSFVYIGEVPVSFRETEDKYFKLSKYDLMLVGNGSEDITLLTNEMLTQEVRVKANECVWGKKSEHSLKGSDYLMILSTAMLGAQLGNMIGSNFDGSKNSETEKREELEEKEKSGKINAKEQEQLNLYRTNQNTVVKGASEMLPGETRYLYRDEKTGLISVEKTTISKSGVGYMGTLNSSISPNGSQIYTYAGLGSNQSFISVNNLGQHASTQISFSSGIHRFAWSTFNNAPKAGITSPSIAAQINNSFGLKNGWTRANGIENINKKSYILSNDSVADNVYHQYEYQNITINGDQVTLIRHTDTSVSEPVINYETIYNGTHYTAGTSGADAIINTSNALGQNNSTWTQRMFGPSGSATAANTVTIVSEVAAPEQYSPPVAFPQQPGWQTSANAFVVKGITNKIIPTGFLLPSYLDDFSSGVDFGYDLVTKKDYSVVKFEAASSGGKFWGGIGSIVGAVLGAVIGLLMAYDNMYDCHDHDQIASMTDFVIFLKGDKVSVTSPDGKSVEEKEVPSDAGELSFTLGGIGASWDFSNADYGEVENVGIKFTNGGLNDTQPRYGTLTINAAKHIHGKIPGIEGSNSTGTGGDLDYDVVCREATFGNYWIGDTNEDGLCTGVSEGTYSQKYHMRVISADPVDQSAYLKKASSCYNGVLTGSTGVSALPKVKLSWDWDQINYDTCAYENENYVYCDATQTTISMIKRLASLEEFLRQNQGVGCPPDAIYEQTIEIRDELNSYTEVIPTGYIGAEKIDVVVENDHMTATIRVNNNTGAPIETFYYYAIKGQGQPVTPDYAPQKTFPIGISEETIEADITKFEGQYYFTVVFNGPSGNRRAITRAFENREASPIGDCWVEKTTRSIGGVPAISYYFAAKDQLVWTPTIRNSSDLFDHINFGAYLIKDSFSPDFMNDFRTYYITNFAEKMTSTERQILDYIASGKIKFSKRFSGSYDFEAGLYDAWFYIDFGDSFSILDSNADVEISLLPVRNPIETYPMYYIPFDGMVGQEGGRNGYGAIYKNLTEGKNNEIKITGPRVLNTVTTYENITGNGVVTVSTKNGANLVTVNSTPGTRGQLASIGYGGYEATINFIPNYATPVILKKNLSGPSGKTAFTILENGQAKNIGGNLTYWTGAAKSSDFYGSGAIDVYNESPDFLLETGDEYGFTWEDATHNGNLYLKTTIFTPSQNDYIIESKDSGTSFWTANSSFNNAQQLIGIQGMTYNSQLNNSTLTSLQDLFNMVAEESVCISNDGTNMTFWWNPRVLEVTPGANNSLANQELSLVGQ